MAVYETHVTNLRSALFLDDCATLVSVLNNRRITALALTAATAAAALSVPSAGATTVGEPKDGVCKFEMNDAEKDFVSSLPRDLSPAPDQQRESWMQALHDAFPEAGAIADEFQNTYTSSDGFRLSYNSDPTGNAQPYVNRMTDVGLAQSAADWYMIELWNKLSLGHPEGGLDLHAFWTDVDTAIANSVIPAADSQPRYLSSKEEGSVRGLSKAQEGMPDDQRKQWVAAYEGAEDVQNARKVSDFRDAFIEARETCANGGGGVLLPTDGPNPDTDKVTTTPMSAAPTQNGGAKTTARQEVSISVSTTVNKVDAASKNTQAQSGSSTSAVIGIVVALLVILGGGAAAAFAMGG